MRNNYLKTNKDDLKEKIQVKQLESLKKFDYVCRKYGLKYWVAYGTLLGTVRHNGFIPWDDDLDIGMLREDYQKLCNLPQTVWGEEFLFCSGYSEDILHDKTFGRVYLKKTVIQSYQDVDYWINPITETSWNTSLMLDIFVYDYIPENKDEYVILYKNGLKISRDYKYLKLKPKLSTESISLFVKSILKRLYKFYLQKILGKSFKSVLKKHEDKINRTRKTNYIGTFLTDDPNIFEYDEVFPLIEGEFEGVKVMMPKNWDSMLTNMYGEYMKFPPESERNHINSIYVDLGDGNKYIVDPIPGSLGENKYI